MNTVKLFMKDGQVHIVTHIERMTITPKLVTCWIANQMMPVKFHGATHMIEITKEI